MKHPAKRALTFALVLAMLLSTVAVTALAEEDTLLIAPNPNANVHVLEASALTAFAAGDKKDGDTEVVEDYFTVIYSAKSKVDGSEKTWEDGYSSAQRINFGGKATTEKNAVKFTTAGPAKVKIWWAQGGDDNREYAILNAAGEVVVKTAGTYEKNKQYLSTLELAEAGTYFLGGETNNNYLFKVEVTESAGETVNVLNASELETFEAGKFADGEAQAVGEYFTVIWSAKAAVNENSKTFADDFAGTKRINFGGTSSLGKSVIKFATSGPANVKVWWVCGGDGRNVDIFDAAGEVAYTSGVESVKNELYISEMAIEEAGTYYLGGSTGNNYLFKIEVTEGAGVKAPRAAWADVAAPAIKSVELDPEDPGKVNVTVTAAVGYDGADQVTVTMRDGDGWQLKTASSLAEKDEHVLSFTPAGTGKVVFSVAATREEETAVHAGAETKDFDFVFPLGVPVMKYAVNDGKGGLTVEWNPVQEATGYTVKAGDKTVTTAGLNATKAVVSGFAVGDKVEVTVTALRGEETGEPCDALEVTVSDEAGIAWVFSAFGTSTKPENDTCEVLDDHTVRVVSQEGKGKIQPTAEDGLAFYYTAVDPKTTNFVLTATANVNTWTYNNGQEGFGIGVLDQVGVNGSTAPVWTNSFMLAVTGLSTVSNKRLGVGALARTGVTEYSSTKPDGFAGAWLADMSGVADDVARNLVGKATNQSSLDSRGPTLSPALTSFKLKLEKNDEGYFVTYTDHNGVTHTEQYPGELSQVDGYVYVGMFAARYMDVTFSDISLTTSAASGSSGGTGETEEKTAAPAFSFRNPTVSNQEKLDLDLRVNVSGKAVVTDAAGKEIYKGVVEAGKTLIPVTLTAGDNKFTAVVTPDQDALTADGAILTSYAEATVTTTVHYAVDERTTIYVAPNGVSGAKGTQAEPTTLADALKNPAPGAVIILMEGTYQLTSGVTVDRGINGTEEKPITLKAADTAATRPVLDWGEKGNGLRINGDWWHLIGFDSTRSTAKGVHIGGNHNVVERVCTYDNLNTGISISRINFGDDIPDWPSYNTVLNCSSWLNADAGYEDADGFEAKLTCGVGNVFDGCVAAYNADDGWDLFARGATIGAVTIKNSVAFKNGYDIVDGKEVNAGNGNGFKLGGGNFAVEHRIVNSIAFDNKANGFTGNSNPSVKVENCTAYNNGKGNLALYTNIADLDTAFEVTGFLSYKGGSDDSIAPRGNQNKTDYLKANDYYQGNASGEAVDETWFKSLDTAKAIASGITRNADGTISMNGCLELTAKAPADAGARLPGSQGANYRDVIPTAWYFEPAYEMREKGIMNGTADSVFAPRETALRAMVATVLHRLADTPAPKADSASTDVAKTDWFAKAVAWAEENEIMAAKDGRFDPNGAITREEAVKALYLYAKMAGQDVDVTASVALQGFTDAKELDEDNVDAMTWAVSRGIINGTSATTLSPKSALTRAELATIVSRFLKYGK